MDLVRGQQQATHRRQRSLLIFLLAVYAGLATLYSVINPIFEAPDEIWHYEYARWIAAGNGLASPEDISTAPWKQEGSQPPLYYFLAAALTLPIDADSRADDVQYNPHAAIGDATSLGNRNMMLHSDHEAWPWHGAALAVHLMRLLSIVFGAATVFFTYRIAALIFAGWPGIGLLAAGLVAFNPQFLFLSAAVNNDNLVTAAATAGVWLCLWLVSRHQAPEARWWAVLGLLVGLAALSKLSGLLLAGLAGLALLTWAWRLHSPRYFAQAGALIVGVALLVAGWWYWRNWHLFGDPLALSVMFAVLPGRAEPANVAELLALAPGVWRSFWAVFGWFNVVVDEWVYAVYGLLTLAALGGWFAGVVFRRREIGEAVRLFPLALLVIWITALMASVVRWSQISYLQGRLLFPAIGAIASLMAGGLWLWLPARWRSGLTAVMLAVLFVLAVIIPFRWIAPIYAPPVLLSSSAQLPNPGTIGFDDQIKLAGYSLETEALQPGDAIDLTLYWQIDAALDRNFSVFVHATDEVGILQAQRDTHPGLGTLPTSRWTPGAIIPDRHRLTIPATAYAPALLRIDIGLYDAFDGARLDVKGRDSFTLGYVRLDPRPAADGIPHRTAIDFGGKFTLVGFDYDRRLITAGEALSLALWWETTALMDSDYVVFTHLVLPPGTVWAQQDRVLQQEYEGATLRTSAWPAGTRTREVYELRPPSEAPPGVYSLQIGLYDKETYERLPVDFSDAGVEIGRVRIIE